MIIPPGPLKVMVATKPVDFRKGAVSLAALIEHELGLKPFSGVVFIFRSRRANRIKLLVWDGSGLVLVSKVLQTGGFHWPRAAGSALRHARKPRPTSAMMICAISCPGCAWSMVIKPAAAFDAVAAPMITVRFDHNAGRGASVGDGQLLGAGRETRGVAEIGNGSPVRASAA